MRFVIVIATTLLFVLGLITIYSTTSAEILDHDLNRSASHAVVKQLAYAVLGTAMGFLAWKQGYRTFLKWSTPLLYLFIFLLILVLVPGVGKEVNGSKRWLGLLGMSFQPSEFAKYVVPAYIIQRFSQREVIVSVKDFLALMIAPVIVVLLILVEPNNGTAAVVAASIVVLCLLMSLPSKYWAIPLCVMAIIGGAFAYHVPYVSARLRVYLHPELDLKGRGHQPFQAKIAAGSGGLLGRGPGNSLQKLSYLPEAQNDYIAAIFAEEFGFLGILGLLVLYASIAYGGFVAALHSQDSSAIFLAGAILFLLCFQAFLNLGVVSGLLPSTGLNLPFFSQGGSSLMANLIGIGLLLSI